MFQTTEKDILHKDTAGRVREGGGWVVDPSSILMNEWLMVNFLYVYPIGEKIYE